MSPETSPTISVTGTSAHSLSYGEWSDTISYELTSGNTKVRITSITNSSGDASDLYGNVTIDYELEDDRANEISSVKFLYSTTGSGGPYLEMDEYTGGDSEGGNNLSTSLTGQSHTFDFDTVSSLGIDFKGNVYIKLRAYDRINFIGDIMESDIRLITIDNSPRECIITFPTEGYFDKNQTPYITGTIPDPRAGNSNLHVRVDIATDVNFDNIELSLASAIDLTGWEYFDDSTWQPIEVSGIPVVSDPTLIGNNWKITVQSENILTTGVKYLRASCGGILV